jgi:hypothetical protein
MRQALGKDINYKKKDVSQTDVNNFFAGLDDSGVSRVIDGYYTALGKTKKVEFLHAVMLANGQETILEAEAYVNGLVSSISTGNQAYDPTGREKRLERL